MIFINPWASYNAEDIPDLNPHDKEGEYGCIAGIIAYCLSSAIFIALQLVILRLRLNDIVGRDMYMCLMLANAIIYAIITICFFKIADYLSNRNKKKKIMVMKGKITFSGRICDFELITRKNLIERGYKYIEKESGVFYKDYDIDFDAPKGEYFTEVKLTFNGGKEISLDGADINSIIPTVRGTFSIYLAASLVPACYEGIKKIEIK